MHKLCLCTLAAVLMLAGADGCKAHDAAHEPISTPGPTFTVAANALSHRWTIVAYGDTRFTDVANTTATNPRVRRWLVAQVAQEHPDALLISGDLPLSGDVTSDYTVYKEETAAWRAEGLRVYPALGNHEMHGTVEAALNNWWSTFPELKEREWYSVLLGNAYILTLDSNMPLTKGSKQQRWVTDQLDHLPLQVQFVFISLHHPPVSDQEPGWDHNVRPNEAGLARLLESHAAHSKAKYIVIAGHIHNYERFEQNGVTYLVAGGGGAKPHPVHRKAPDLYLDPAFPNYHYVTFAWDGKILHCAMHRVADPAADKPSWEIKDRFDITP